MALKEKLILVPEGKVRKKTKVTKVKKIKDPILHKATRFSNTSDIIKKLLAINLYSYPEVIQNFSAEKIFRIEKDISDVAKRLHSMHVYQKELIKEVRKLRRKLNDDTTIENFLFMIAAYEREECAKLAESVVTRRSAYGKKIALAIRERVSS